MKKLLFTTIVALILCVQVSLGQECVITCPPSLTICPGASTSPASTGMAFAQTGSGTGSGSFCDPYIISSSDNITINAKCPGAFLIRRTWTATNSNNPNQTMSCVQTINQVDIELPSFNGCPDDITVESSFGDCDEAVVTWVPPSATDNCGIAYTSSNYNPGDVFTSGQTMVEYVTTDNCGNSVSCSFIVDVTCGPDGGGEGGGGPVANCGADGMSNGNVHFSFNQCQSNYISGTNQDFSEFTSTINVAGDSECMVLSSSGISRNVPEIFTHSCTAGVYDTPAMCVGVNKNCVYEPNSNEAVRFSVSLDPLMGASRLEHLEFYELAPTSWAFLGGDTGPNDYPTRYAIRVLANGAEIFHEFDIQTTQEWSREYFDFSNNPAFEVNTATVFEFELTAYCSILGNSSYSVWDLDALSVNVSCGQPTANDIVNGGILTGGPFVYCADESTYFIEQDLIGLTENNGSEGQWVITDMNGIIVDLPSSPYLVDFASFDHVNSLIFYVSYNPPITGFTNGYSIYSQIVGCYGLSNPLAVSAQSVENCLPDDIDFEESVYDDPMLNFDLYPNPTQNFLIVNITGMYTDNFNYTITDVFGKNISKSNNEIIDQTNFELDVTNLRSGIYLIKIGNGVQAVTKKFIKVE